MVEFGRGCTARGACIVQLTVAVPTMPPGTLNLLQLDDGVLANVVTQLAVADPLARRTLMLGVGWEGEGAAHACMLPPAAMAAACRQCRQRQCSSAPCCAAVCTRLRGLAQAAVHSYQRPGQSIMDAVDLAAPGDTLHLLPGYYKASGADVSGLPLCHAPASFPVAMWCTMRRMSAVLMEQPHACAMLQEALLLRKALHLTCDEGQARILSPARFAIMCNAGGCLLENLVLKSHQVGCGGTGLGRSPTAGPTAAASPRYPRCNASFCCSAAAPAHARPA